MLFDNKHQVKKIENQKKQVTIGANRDTALLNFLGDSSNIQIKDMNEPNPDFDLSKVKLNK